MKRRVIWYIRLLCQFSMGRYMGDYKFCSKIMRKMGRPRIPIELLPINALQYSTLRVSTKNSNALCYPNNWESMGQDTSLKMAKS